MDWFAWLGGSYAQKKPASRTTANDPQLRLAKLKRVYHTILQLSNQPRNLTNEGPLLDELRLCIDKIVAYLREEARAPAPHLCLQFASANQVYNLCARAATVTRYEPIVQSTIAVYAALVDSEEEDFLLSQPFAKGLMRLSRKILESGAVLINIDTETAILELLFTIAAKIRLQPEILSFWFQSTVKPELEDVFVKEKKSFVGITQKDDFPLCYLLIDRVHHEGRIGDFARTGLLYIFEATGRSENLEEWVVSSDLPTLMASGLGALYSQLSRELSIIHPDATLPAVLAMSDYSTTHPRATAESAFSDRHRSHMSTFLSYLAFWQDVLDHCKSADVKQTLLDHFQILFLQQLLYPSILQSSDTDAGSSVAVLTYMNAMLQSLEYPDLMRMMLVYLLAVESDMAIEETPITPSKPPRSPTTMRRRQSLMLLATPKDPGDAVDPSLFNLVDLVMNNISSKNDQSVYAALKLASTLLNRQKQFAFGTLLRVQKPRHTTVSRTSGALQLELERLTELATSLHRNFDVEGAYAGLTEDVRLVIEAQVPFVVSGSQLDGVLAGRYLIRPHDHLLRVLRDLLRTFFTNGVEVNLALTQTLIGIALCIEVRLDAWLTLDPSTYSFVHVPAGSQRPWHEHLDDDENVALTAIQKVSLQPTWPDESPPMIHTILQALAAELEVMRSTVLDLDILITGRKHMLQANIDGNSGLVSAANSPSRRPSVHDALRPKSMSHRDENPGLASLGPGKENLLKATGSPHGPSRSLVASPIPTAVNDSNSGRAMSPLPSAHAIFQPPPPDVPSTTDVLMQEITFPSVAEGGDTSAEGGTGDRKASLNHVLTNIVVLQEFVLELAAVMQVRAAVLGEKEVRSS